MSAPVRRVLTEQRSVFLTFDDGPDPQTTPQVLQVLRARGARATFFMVAQQAQAHRSLLAGIEEHGHAIGNHSLDHRYGAFFGGRRRMLRWIEQSQRAFADLGCSAIVGFRPPAGVRTPELHWALDQLGLPLVLWSRRFLDSLLPWNVARADRALVNTQQGEIVLLHDRQREKNREQFLRTLDHYVAQLQDSGFKLDALPALARSVNGS
ncbi:MAG TPA: polysaccharide deacetylase family protein [Polyangiaceae bacterium]|nr:polysaccharide deacetylase family protein [Polyangiaceae bacterium]